jgi:hypothetical protein
MGQSFGLGHLGPPGKKVVAMDEFLSDKVAAWEVVQAAGAVFDDDLPVEGGVHAGCGWKLDAATRAIDPDILGVAHGPSSHGLMDFTATRESQVQLRSGDRDEQGAKLRVGDVSPAGA